MKTNHLLIGNLALKMLNNRKSKGLHKQHNALILKIRELNSDFFNRDGRLISIRNYHIWS
jgi:hypothetical protein